MAIIVCRETPTASASSAWVKFFCSRNFLIWLIRGIKYQKQARGLHYILDADESAHYNGVIPSEQYYQYTGTASVNLGTIPRWRTYTTLDWANHGVDAFVGVTWVDSVTDIGTGGDDNPRPECGVCEQQDGGGRRGRLGGNDVC